jgi:hypothetical protein
MRYVKIVIGVVVFLFGALWLAAVAIQNIAGVTNMPANITTLHDAARGALIWLAHTPPLAAYPFGLAVMALGVGILFWHPEKGWRWFFERSTKAKEQSSAKDSDEPESKPDAPMLRPAPMSSPDQDAKRTLANFVLRDLGPAMDEVKLALRLSSDVIQSVDPGCPQAQWAAIGVNVAQPPSDILDAFNDWEHIRDEPTSKLEEIISLAISKYSDASTTVHDVVISTAGCPAKWDTVDFIDKSLRWISIHRDLEKTVRELTSNVRYSRLRSDLKSKDWFKIDAVNLRDTIVMRHGLTILPRLRGFVIESPKDGAWVNHKERIEISCRQEPNNLFAYLRTRDNRWFMQGPFRREGNTLIIDEAHFGVEDLPNGTRFLFTVIQAPERPKSPLDGLSEDWPRLPAIEVLRRAPS